MGNPDAAEVIVRCFFDFFRDVRSGIIGFEGLFGSGLSEKAIKSRRFRWSCHEKVKKTLYRSATKCVLEQQST